LLYPQQSSDAAILVVLPMVLCNSSTGCCRGWSYC